MYHHPRCCPATPQEMPQPTTNQHCGDLSKTNYQTNLQNPVWQMCHSLQSQARNPSQPHHPSMQLPGHTHIPLPYPQQHSNKCYLRPQQPMWHVQFLEIWTTQDAFCVISRNSSILNLQSLDMVVIATELQNRNVSIFLAQEMNTAWLPQALHNIQTKCNQVHRHTKIATSSSTDGNDRCYQPGEHSL